MISVVSFDYFEPFDYFDVGFTDVGAWSPEFSMLGYETLNFLIGLGSIIIFAAFQLLVIVIFLSMRILKLKCSCRCLRGYFSL